jgi:hypothetical protein
LRRERGVGGATGCIYLGGWIALLLRSALLMLATQLLLLHCMAVERLCMPDCSIWLAGELQQQRGSASLAYGTTDMCLLGRAAWCVVDAPSGDRRLSVAVSDGSTFASMCWVAFETRLCLGGCLCLLQQQACAVQACCHCLAALDQSIIAITSQPKLAGQPGPRVVAQSA